MLHKGFITEEEKEKLKKLYDCQLYMATGKKGNAVYRAITHNVMDKIEKAADEYAKEGKGQLPLKEAHNIVLDECLVWPEFPREEREEDVPIGTIPSLVKKIEEASGFIDLDIFHRVLGPDIHSVIIKDDGYWGDISDEELEILKKESKFTLAKVRIGKYIFIVRPMTRIDVTIASGAIDDQIALAKAVTMWPKDVDWSKIPAGYIEKLGSETNRISGWSAEAEVTEI